MKKENDASWVEIAALGQDEHAALIAGLLESEGIPCEVEGPSSHPLPENLGSFGMSRVMVPSDRADEARELLATRERESLEDSLSSADDTAE